MRPISSTPAYTTGTVHFDVLESRLLLSASVQFAPVAPADQTASNLSFSRVIVDASMSGDIKCAGDIDLDGMPDLVVGGEAGTAPLTWYRYVSPTAWTKTVIANATQEWTTEGTLADIDGDGDLDIIAADGNGDNNLKWIENPVKEGGDVFNGADWVVHAVGSAGGFGKNVSVADFNHDGRMDIAARSEMGLAIFFQGADGSWAPEDFSFNDSGAQLGNEGMTAGDINGDGYADLVIRGRWLENPGNAGGKDPTNPAGWQEHIIGSGVDTSYQTLVVDLDKDGRQDVLYSDAEGTGDVIWFRQTAAGWEKHVVASDIEMAHTLQVADFDNNGQLDVLVGQMDTSVAQEIAIYSNADLANDAGWQKFVVDTTGIHKGVAVDLGNDGKMDIFGCNFDNAPVYVWINGGGTLTGIGGGDPSGANHAPVLTASGPLVLPNIPQDSSYDTVAVSSLIDGRVTDSDAGALSGIAVTHVDGTGGTLQYTIDNTVTWNTFDPSIRDTSALLLNSSAQIRFLPADGFAGSIANLFTFRAWDQTSGANGETADTSANGSSTAFSAASLAISITVDAPPPVINSAPVLDTNTPLVLPDVLKNSRYNSISVAELLDNRYNDVNTKDLVGIALTGQDSVNGLLEYTIDNTITWNSVPSLSDTRALLLGITCRLRFTPNAGYTGTTADLLTFRGWDQTSGAIGDLTDASINGGSTAFSASSLSASLSVVAPPPPPPNHAPVLMAATPVVLPDVAQGSFNNLINVSALMAGRINDSDPDDLAGVAVTGVNGANGVCEYSTDKGATWTAFASSTSDSAAILLDAKSLIRFTPDTGYAGTIADLLTFRAWDQTSGDVGDLADASVNGGSTAFSANSLSAGLSVDETPPPVVNHAPVLSTATPLVLPDVAENSSNNLIHVSTLISSRIDDSDPGAVAGIAVTGVNGANGVCEYSINNGVTWTAFASSTSDSAAILLDANSLIRYTPDAGYAGTTADLLTFRAWDQTSGDVGDLADASVNGGSTAFSANSLSAGLSVDETPPPATNNAPVLTSGAFSITQTGGSNSRGTSITDLLNSSAGSYSDADPNALKGIAVVGTNNAYGQWQYSTDGGQSWITFKGYYTSARLLAANANTYIRCLPTGNYTGTMADGITFRAWDQTSGTNGGVINTITARGGSSSVSLGTATVATTIPSGNAAPILNLGSFAMTQTVNGGLNKGTRIADLLASDSKDYADADPNALKGIAVVGTNNSYGQWQYSTDGGQSWITFKGYYTAARLLAADANTYIRCLPTGNYTGTMADGITFRAWDQTAGTNGGVINTMTARGGSSSVSLGTATVATTILNAGQAVNSAPVLTPGPFSMGQIATGAANNGIKIADLLNSSAGSYSDADLNALKGIAVVGTNNTYGKWQYSTDGGHNWITFKGYYTAARLLAADANTYIRFLPTGNYTGTMADGITFRAWDQTAGTNGGVIDTMAARGGSSSVSLATAKGSIEVLG